MSDNKIKEEIEACVAKLNDLFVEASKNGIILDGDFCSGKSTFGVGEPLAHLSLEYFMRV